MFRKTEPNSQLNLFTCTQNFLNERQKKEFEKSTNWHNIFRTQILERINEELFSRFYHDSFGAPNASIRVLIGMNILKEAFNWSDEQLFMQCLFNLQVRYALGLDNIDDPIPAEFTYYQLRRRIVQWNMEGEEDILEEVFAHLTKDQILEFVIDAKRVRMDSKLLGSNIKWYTRYELIHETLRKAYSSNKSQIDPFLSESDIAFLNDIIGETGDKVSYRSNISEIESRLHLLGIIIYKIISINVEDPKGEIDILRSVFEQQYEIVDGKVLPREKEKIEATSIQSPHDPYCHFRKKDEEKIKGYSINVIETSNKDNKVNLVTSVIVEPASTADCNFFKPAIQATQELTGQQVKQAHTDGAFHSEENMEFCKEHDIDHIIGAIQGKQSRYDLNYDDNGELIVTDLQTNTIVPIQSVKSETRKWKILTEDKKWRYFTEKDVEMGYIRRQIACRSPEELNVRNNVEATIFQLCYHFPNNKSKYRGIIKHKMWAFLRCIWINFVRIMNYLKSLTPNCEMIELSVA